MKIRCFNIEWDADEDDATSDIPDELIIECDAEDLDDECFLVDTITDETGFYVLSHEHEIVPIGPA